MILSLDMNSNIPIYVQLRNQIVMGIGRGELRIGESLPTVRQIAADAGINTMTANKAYQILKAEGFITIDRRKGATVCPTQDGTTQFQEKLASELELLSAEACINGIKEQDFLKMCENVYAQMQLNGHIIVEA